MYTISIVSKEKKSAKTTTALNLAAGLSLVEYYNNPNNPEKILFISLDKNGDGSLVMEGKFSKDVKARRTIQLSQPSIFNLLLDETPPPPTEVIRRSVIPFRPQKSGNLFYIPFNKIQQELLQKELKNTDLREQRFKLFLKHISSDFKYVIIDTSSETGGLLTLNALTASSHYIIPMSLTGKGLKSLEIVQETIISVQKKFNSKIKLIGILPIIWNPHSSETILAREVLSEKGFMQREIMSPIQKRAAVDSANQNGIDIFSYIHLRPSKLHTEDERQTIKEFSLFVGEVINRLNFLEFSTDNRLITNN